MDAPEAPYEWLVSRVCEEFSCLPSQARRELEHDPDHLALRIISLRDFARTKAAYDRDGDNAAVPKGAIFDMVKEIDFALAKAELDRAVAQIAAEEGGAVP